MPFSSESGKDYIKSLNLVGDTILDVGAGSGTYRKLFPNLGKHWTAIEIWSPYVSEYNLTGLYDEVIIQDARDVKYGKYDIAFVGDILEHMSEEDAQTLLNTLKRCCKYVVVSIPLGHYPQGEYAGNPYEKHVVDNYTHERVMELFGDCWRHHIDNEIGVYVYRRLKIAINAISKNEAEFVKRFCDSGKDADLILIADTGSTDKTVEYALECGAEVRDICISPWRFDHARNAALALVPKDIDVVISLDLDEVMEPGWREEIERVWMPNTTRLRYKFDWGCGISFFYEKIFSRHGYRWHHPVHEYPKPDGRINEVYAVTDKLLVSHHPDPTKSRGQYMPLLELAVKEDPSCPRNAFYFCRELTFHNRWQEAIDALKKYLVMPGADWPNERCYAMRLLGKSYESIGNGWEALKWYRLAVAEAPNTREPWVELSMFCYMHHMWAECYSAAVSALAIQNKEEVYTMDPSVWSEKPYDLASLAAYNLGLKAQAVDYCQKALEFAPKDNRLLTNLKYYMEGLGEQSG